MGEQRLTELRTWHPLLLGLQLPGHNRAPGIREQAQDLPYHVAQLIQNPLAMQETWVQSLNWEDPLEKEKATHSNILA